MLDLQTCRTIAKEYGLKEIDLSKSQGSVSFVSPFRSFRINIYFENNTVVTQIMHPKHGLCSLQRYGITPSVLKSIIRAPEPHAGLSKYSGKVGKANFGPAPIAETLNGQKLWFVGLRSFRDEIKANWKPKICANFALGPDSFLALGVRNKSKYHAWWSNLPKPLKTSLRKREYALPEPISCALGSGDRYFIKFANGAFEWVASKSFSKLLKRFPKIAHVAFGADWDSYHILFLDGTQAWNDIPKELERILEGRKESMADVKEVSLCPDNPSFFHVIFADGSWRSHGVPQIMEKQLYYGHQRVLFGGKGQCLLTYNEDVTEEDDESRSDEDDRSYTEDVSDEERFYDDDEWVVA